MLFDIFIVLVSFKLSLTDIDGGMIHVTVYYYISTAIVSNLSKTP